jgi:hypothetical protein
MVKYTVLILIESEGDGRRCEIQNNTRNRYDRKEIPLYLWVLTVEIISMLPIVLNRLYVYIQAKVTAGHNIPGFAISWLFSVGAIGNILIKHDIVTDHLWTILQVSKLSISVTPTPLLKHTSSYHGGSLKMVPETSLTFSMLMGDASWKSKILRLYIF